MEIPHVRRLAADVGRNSNDGLWFKAADMITWDLFPLMSLVSVILWLSGAVMALVRKPG